MSVFQPVHIDERCINHVYVFVLTQIVWSPFRTLPMVELKEPKLTVFPCRSGQNSKEKKLGHHKSFLFLKVLIPFTLSKVISKSEKAERAGI